MGIFSFLFGDDKKPQPAQAPVHQAAPQVTATGVPPETIAVISAAVCAMSGPACVCFRIQPGTAWTMSSRMNAIAPHHSLSL